MGGHRNLVAWRKAMALVKDIYRSTAEFPKHEMYGLASQLRRAAVSIPSNLAEGYGRNSRTELHQFVGMARGSLAEVETQIEIARDLGYLRPENAADLLERSAEIGRMLTGLREWSGKTKYRS
jgi:four helix bundle protein